MAHCSTIFGMACWTPTAGSRTLITCRRQDVFLFLLRGAPVAPTSNPRNGCSGRRFAAASPGDNAAVLERISCCASGAELEAGLAQFNGSYSNPASLDGYSIRIDQVINSKLNLFGRYNYSPSSLDQRGPLFPSGSVLSTTESLSSSIQTFKLGVTGLSIHKSATRCERITATIDSAPNTLWTISAEPCPFQIRSCFLPFFRPRKVSSNSPSWVAESSHRANSRRTSSARSILSTICR